MAQAKTKAKTKAKTTKGKLVWMMTRSTSLHSLINSNVLLMCANYFYMGELVEVNEDTVTLKNPSIVYETGGWDNGGYADAQRLHQELWYVQRSAIESFGLSK